MISSSSRVGMPALGKGQATGRVDVPVDATKFATSFDNVDVALLHRSPQCVVLVNQGSHVEKKEKTPQCDVSWTPCKLGNSWMKGLTCGLLSMGKRWTGMQLWPKLGFMTRTPFVVVGGFWEGLNGSDNHHKIFRVSGHALCVGRNGCGPRKFDAFGVGIRNIMNLFLLVRSLVQLEELHKECLPRIRLSGETVARMRYLVNMCLLWLCHSSLQLKVAGSNNCCSVGSWCAC